ITDRRRLKDILEELDIPEGMGVIVRTAGAERSKAEIKRDYEYLLRLWNEIRDLTLRSTAPALIYEEGNLIKRSIRDLYTRDIDETAVRTNLEAAEGIARQLRLRDLAGLIVIDFIDMEEHRNQSAVERRLKEALKNDRARIQVGRISAFGLLEMSRQRLRPSLVETSTQPCPHCGGTGFIRSTESTALYVLRW